MEERSIVKVLILSIVTFGIYGILWHFWTTKELNAKGATIPTAWLQIIPLANIYFYFKYYEGAEKVTGGNVSGILYFVLALFVSPIVSLLLTQNEYNKMHPAAGGAAMDAPQTPAQPAAMPEQAASTPDTSAASEPAPATPEATTPAPEPTPTMPVADAAPAAAPVQDVTPAPAAPTPDVTPAPTAEQPAAPAEQPTQKPPLVQ